MSVRRDGEGETVEAEVEILPERALLDEREETALRRRDDAHADLARRVAADAANLTGLQHGDQLGMRDVREEVVGPVHLRVDDQGLSGVPGVRWAGGHRQGAFAMRMPLKSLDGWRKAAIRTSDMRGLGERRVALRSTASWWRPYILGRSVCARPSQAARGGAGHPARWPGQGVTRPSARDRWGHILARASLGRPFMDDARTLQQIATNAHSRRELLYLRALEKGDEREARALLRVDPSIVQRLRSMGLDPEQGVESELPRELRDRMGRLWDACWRHHAVRP